MLPGAHRLRSSADYRSVRRGRGGRRARGTLLVVQAAPPAASAETRHARVGFVVPRAVGNAVVRNRTKRRLRALVAGRLTALPAATDVVVHALPAAASATSAQLGNELDHLLPRALTSPPARGRR